MPNDVEILETAERYLLDVVRPKAEEIDRNSEALRAALAGLCERRLMALRRPEAYGGPALNEEAFRGFQETCARVSGTLAFLQTQHQSAVSMLSKSANDTLKSKYLPKMDNGERLVGIGFSQLRRSGDPIMQAEPHPGGYILHGHVPWVTGWDFYPEFLIGASLPDGQALFAVVPLASSESIRISTPMELAAMQAANTVTIDFDGYLLSEEQVAFIQPAGWIRRNDMVNVALQGHFALGCAQAGIDILAEAAQKKGLSFLCDARDALIDELQRCRQTTLQAQAAANEETTEERLAVRAWAIDLAVRCAHAAVTASSGAANSLRHPAQRVYREALVYTVSAQTTEIMEATLRRLVHPPTSDLASTPFR